MHSTKTVVDQKDDKTSRNLLFARIKFREFFKIGKIAKFNTREN